MPITTIDNPTLKAMLAHGSATVLDVRTHEEHAFLGTIPGAVLLPMHEIPARLGELDPQTQWVVVCEHGVRSLNVSHYLEAQGYPLIFNPADGMAAWDGERVFDNK
jgi:rhodanese-related sulfurtransferase